jgi:transcriptional regulator with XRE-family HTH domain
MISSGSTPPLGQQIRALRRQRRMTLKDLARRVGTSAPALHRYETGWDRFEVATLRRIAAALGAELEVRLRAADSADTVKEPGELRTLLAPLFWDRRLSVADLRNSPLWVLGRVLTYGDLAQVQAARRFYGDDAVREAIGRRGIDPRTRNYWQLLLDTGHASEGTERRGLEDRS